MSKYRVEVAYRTKRGGVCRGMEINAFSPEEAQEAAERQILEGYPARKWAYTRVSQGKTSVVSTPLDINGANLREIR